jgi:hypothetical protein
MELRCPNKKFANVLAAGTGAVVEVKCDSRFCGAGEGAVVLHRFEISTQKLIKTTAYKNPKELNT